MSAPGGPATDGAIPAPWIAFSQQAAQCPAVGVPKYHAELSQGSQPTALVAKGEVRWKSSSLTDLNGRGHCDQRSPLGEDDDVSRCSPMLSCQIEWVKPNANAAERAFAAATNAETHTDARQVNTILTQFVILFSSCAYLGSSQCFLWFPLDDECTFICIKHSSATRTKIREAKAACDCGMARGRKSSVKPLKFFC